MNNFYEPEFYPTPPEVIRKMVEPYAKTLERATILEPSAGRGDILDYITNKGIDTVETNSRGVPFDYTCKANPKKVYAIEKKSATAAAARATSSVERTSNEKNNNERSDHHRGHEPRERRRRVRRT